MGRENLPLELFQFLAGARRKINAWSVGNETGKSNILKRRSALPALVPPTSQQITLFSIDYLDILWLNLIKPGPVDQRDEIF
jgi:hypothetical protein